jgi:hypothetical protein
VKSEGSENIPAKEPHEREIAQGSEGSAKVENSWSQKSVDVCVNSYPVQCKYSSITNKQYSITRIIKCGVAQRLRLVNGNLHVTMEKELNVYNMNGNQTTSIKFQHSYHPCVSSSLPFNNNTYIIADSNLGIFRINIKDELVTKISAGNFSDVYEFKNKLYTLEYITGQVYVFFINNKSVSRIHAVKLNGFSNGNCEDRICVNEKYLFISSFGNCCLYKYTDVGLLVSRYGQYGTDKRGDRSGLLDRPSLCDVDSRGSVLITDLFNNRLQICTVNGIWAVISLPSAVSWPIDAVVDTQDHSLWVIDGENLYHLKSN